MVVGAWLPDYGLNSPFTDEERVTVTAVVRALNESPTARAEALRTVIREQFDILEGFGRLLSRLPRSCDIRRDGGPSDSVAMLERSLCRSTPADFEFQAPVRALPGRALDMTEINFYRLLRCACDAFVPEDKRQNLLDQLTARMRTVIYTKLVEELLSDIVSDPGLEMKVRRRAVHALIDLWDGRLTYRASKMFPLLQATWEARQKLKVIGGTYLGAHEMFALFREGCDPQFVDYFTREDPEADEVAAFREFLFGKSAEQLAKTAERMEKDGLSCLSPDSETPEPSQPGTALYAFFRSRFLQATARRLAGTSGPKRTAEGYVMIMFLSRESE